MFGLANSFQEGERSRVYLDVLDAFVEVNEVVFVEEVDEGFDCGLGEVGVV